MKDDGSYAKIEEDYSYDDTSDPNRFIAFKNPFRYRSYYYDFETDLYYLNSRYYDPEIGRFINADDISALDVTQITLNGLNLYAYCNNNPINYYDPNGTFLMALILTFLALTTIAGAVVGGVTAYNNGARGWDLAKSIILGGAFGLAVGGAIVATGAVFLGAFGFTSVLGVSVLQIFAIGALAFDFTAFIIAPLFGVDMDGIEFEKPTNNTPSNQQPEYIYPTFYTNRLKNNLLIKLKREDYDKILWEYIRHK